MKKYIHIYIIAIAFSLIFTGCIKETFPDDSYATSTQIEKSSSALKSLMNAIPAIMVNYGNDDAGIESVSYATLQLLLETTTTDMVVSGDQGWDVCGAFSRAQSLDAKLNNRGKYIFFAYYGYIKTVNDIIAKIDSTTKDPTLKAYLGIAHAYRALYYMDIVQIYEFKENKYLSSSKDILGLGVPIVTEKTTNADAKNNPRKKVSDVYDLIFSDLSVAEKDLSDYTRDSKTTPNLAVVDGLYARAYLNRASAGDNTLWEKAAEYARKAITESGCTPLTQDQWEDATNGFNNMDSQNSWMWATSISTNNTAATASGFNYTMLLSCEQSWLVYGWCVGRSLSRRTYDQIPDNDFRKHSWLDPQFFKESGDIYSGYQYKVASSYSHIRSQITKSNGFLACPYVYVSIKFKPKERNYTNANIGGATDYPIMRVEEMYFIEAEAEAHNDLSKAEQLLNDFMKYRITDSSYDCTKKVTDLPSFISELIFQKRVEFWGEGRNYYDAKRLELGLHRGYKGINASSYKNTFDLDNIAPQWTLPFPTAEIEGNTAIRNYDNPDPSSTSRWWASSNDILINNYGN